MSTSNKKAEQKADPKATREPTLADLVAKQDEILATLHRLMANITGGYHG